MHLSTAEGVTRFLRSKSTKIDEILATSIDLLNGKLDIYFPGDDIFLFELYCDRLSDAKNKSFRLDYRSWDLFQRVWYKLNSDATARSRIFKKIKYVDLLSLTHNDIKCSKLEPQVVEKLLTSAFESLGRIMTDSYLEIDENSFISLLSSYLQVIYKVVRDGYHNWEKIRAWTITMNKLFLLSNLHMVKVNKKIGTKFTTETLTTLLNLVVVKGNTITDILNSMVEKVIFTKEGIKSLKGNTEILVKNKDTSVAALVHFFNSSINAVSKSDMKLCEEIFVCMTAAHSEISEQLLSTLSKANRTLSTEFLLSILSRELESKTQNWELICHLIDLDVDIALSYSERILEMVTSQKYCNSHIIGEKVVDAHIKAREFLKFFTIWQNAINKDLLLWGSMEFSLIISNKINNFSPTQLAILTADLMKQLEDPTILIMLSSITQSLKKIPQISINAVEASFTGIFETKIRDCLIWELRYELLCIYPSFYKYSAKLIEASASSTDSVYLYFTLFRIREKQEFDLSNICENFVKYIKRKPEFLALVFKRWLVFINTFFSRESVRSLISLLLEDKVSLEQVLKNDYFYEQRNLIDATLSLVVKLLKSDTGINTSMDVIMIVPPHCFSRHFKDELLQIIFEIATKSNDGEVLLKSRENLVHLLSQPTFRSTIETKVEAIEKLLSTSPNTVTQSKSLQVFDLIWSHNVQQCNEKVNKVYVDALLAKLQTFFKRKSFKEFDHSYELALSILKNKSISTLKLESDFTDNYVAAIHKLLNYLIKSKDYNKGQVSWLLNALYEVHCISSLGIDKTHSLVKTLATSFEGSVHYDLFSVHFFRLFAKTAELDIKSSLHIMSLYLTMKDYSDVNSLDMKIAFKDYLFRLPKDVYTDSLHFLLKSIEVSQEFIESQIDILVCFVTTIKKEYEMSRCLFAKSLSTILANFPAIKSSGCFIEILSSLKSSLTESSWCFTQYSFELSLTLLSKIAFFLSNTKIENADDVYVLLTSVLSHMLLFHRFRLSHRNHLVISIFISMMECLSIKNKTESSSIADSRVCGSSFSRVLTNLCEPPNTSSKDSDSLSSTASVIKSSLRKHLPVLLINFVHMSLRYVFKSENRKEMLPGIFSIFDVLSQTETELISSSLDSPSKTYYRTLYEEYKKLGKWRDS